MKETGNISIHTENIFPIIKKFLYSDHEIFLRELVSNAVDATQKIKRLSSIGEFNGELGELKVKISFDKDKKTITISDNGIGMTAEEIKKYINQIAFSGATEFVEKYRDILAPYIYKHESVTVLGDGTTSIPITERLEIPCTFYDRKEREYTATITFSIYETQGSNFIIGAPDICTSFKQLVVQMILGAEDERDRIYDLVRTSCFRHQIIRIADQRILTVKLTVIPTVT